MIFKTIPGKLKNKTIVGAIDRLRKIEKLIKRNFTQNDISNVQAYRKRMAEKPGFRTALIERQADFTDMSLGKSTLDYSGCEVIAVYNLLLKYGGGDLKVELPDLIEIFEKDGILHAGRFGVSMKSIKKYLGEIGIEVNYTTDEEDFDLLGHFCDHFILTVMNDREDIFRQIHTFYISKDGERLIAHNAGLRMRYYSISEIIGALNGGKAKGICLMAVKERSEKTE
ncbi:MAG: hypothetical protein IJH69_05680 [Firmicutes bacterium]|nr:hypothetical protein [Bacillota bacterium]MBQ6608579.1 hypothetical protein [Bacillota bacterium]MBR3184204.1 hypothetical protein [Bacillota bacterium]